MEDNIKECYVLNIMFKRLNWEQTNVKFRDPQVTMIESSLRGNFTREDAVKTLRQVKESLDKQGKKNYKIGVGMHYGGELDEIVPAIMTNENQNIKVWDPNDSPDTDNLYEGVPIVGLTFTVINLRKANINPTHIRPKRH